MGAERNLEGEANEVHIDWTESPKKKESGWDWDKWGSKEFEMGTK